MYHAEVTVFGDKQCWPTKPFFNLLSAILVLNSLWLSILRFVIISKINVKPFLIDTYIVFILSWSSLYFNKEVLRKFNNFLYCLKYGKNISKTYLWYKTQVPVKPFGSLFENGLSNLQGFSVLIKW